MSESLVPLGGGELQASDGTRLVYLSVGTGPVLVFVHGGLGRGSNWIGVCDDLADGFTCVMLDRRGHGHSDWGKGPSIVDEARDVLELIERVGPVHGVVGHSYGAIVALHAALAGGPITIPRLVLYEPPLGFDMPIMTETDLAEVERFAAVGDYEAALGTHLRASSGGVSEPEMEMLRTSPLLRSVFADMVIQAPTIAPGIREVHRLTGVDRYRDVAIPTRFLLGSESPDQPFGAAVRALTKVMPHATVDKLMGQAHMAMLHTPQLVAAAVRAAIVDATDAA